MSGIELVGLLLGIFPLAISAMEHYEESKKAISGFWRFRRAYRKDLRSLRYCDCALSLHAEELLQQLLPEDTTGDPGRYVELLKDPDSELEDALASRLRKRYQIYKETLEELQILMLQLAKAVKVNDPQFQSALACQSPVSTRLQLMHKANTSFQLRKLKYSLSQSSREELLREVEKCIKRLQDLLAAVDRVANCDQDGDRNRNTQFSKRLLHFWHHAERVYRLLRRSMTCGCKSMHSARLWLRYHKDTEANIRLLLQFAEDNPRLAFPWTAEDLRVQHTESLKPIAITHPKDGKSHQALRKVRFCAVTRTNVGQVQRPVAVNASQNSPIGPEAVARDLLLEGICKALSKIPMDNACIGDLVDEHENVHYQVFSVAKTIDYSKDSVAASELLGGDVNSSRPFYRPYRYGVALKLAAAQLQYHSTSWFPGRWSLVHIRFPKHHAATGDIDYERPYIQTDFELGVTHKRAAPARDQSFWTLGVVLLELCFGRLLKDHNAFKDPALHRDPDDPFQQQGVALDWAQEVELEAGSDYSCAVKWCLQQAPLDPSDMEWRNDFAKNVLLLLQRSCEPFKAVAQ